MASSVPKFASFRPKPKSSPDFPKESKDDRKTENASKQRSSKSTRDSTPPNKKLKLERAKSPSSKVYFRDRRGDPDIARYGTLNHYDIPSYRRFGYGFVLGSCSMERIDRTRSSDKSIVFTPTVRQRQERLLTSKHADKKSNRLVRFVKSKAKPSEPGLDFIPVSESRKARKEADDDEDEDDDLNDDEDPLYRELDDPRTSSTHPLDPDTYYDSSEQDDHEDYNVPRTNAELVRQTREHPEELQAWLKFIAHQHAMVKHDLPPDVELVDSARKQLADTRISIYEEALRKIGSNQANQIQLYRGLLLEAKYSLSEMKLSSKWREIITKFPQSLELWLGYLDHVQSSLTQFKYDSCRATFLQFFTTIGHSSEENSATDILHVFIRMTTMMQQAGYQELALAAWQVILERTLFQANGPNQNQNFAEAFEDFWESEVPRVGEHGAKGWLVSNIEDDPPLNPPELSAKDPAVDMLKDFEVRESDAIIKLRYPGRATHDVGGEDAFHTIFYNDIEDYVTLLPADVQSQLLLEAFLCFCGLPPLPNFSEHQRAWWSDPFLRHTTSKSSARSCQQGTNNFLNEMQRLNQCSIQSFQMSCELLFGQDFSLEHSRLSADFVRRILKLFATRSPDDEAIGEYLIAFEAYHFPVEAFKTAKRLIKARPTSLRLYNAYGLLEAKRGNLEKADQALSIALSMQKENELLMTPESLQLLVTWVWAALDRGERDEALWRLVSPRGRQLARDNSKLRTAEESLLEAQKVLGEACEQALLRQDYISAVLSTSLLAILAYLSDEMNATAALSVFKNLDTWLASHKLSSSPYAELHAQAIARLLIHHASQASMVKPSLIRSGVEPLLKYFPNNTIILSLYTANEARFTIDDRVRGIMRQTALQTSDTTTVAGWAFSIHYEVLRGELAGSTSHSIRALYKRATKTNASGIHCPEIWKLYLRFELAQLQKAKVKAQDKRPRKDGKKRSWETRVEEAETRLKETFYLGLRNLPWCKDFILMAFADAKVAFTEEELLKVYRIMQEKELRLYIDLEET